MITNIIAIIINKRTSENKVDKTKNKPQATGQQTGINEVLKKIGILNLEILLIKQMFKN